MTRRRSHTLHRSMLGAASAIALMIAGVSAAAQDVETKTFNIEAQPLSEALLKFSRQSDVNVIAPTSLTRGLTATPVSGEYTPEQALKTMLGDADLEMRTRENGSIVLASMRAEEERDGRFRLAQVDQEETRDVERVSEDNETDRDQLERDEIIVTGTNIRGVQNPTVPIITFDREDIDLSGVSTLEDFMRLVPQNLGSQSALVFNSNNRFLEFNSSAASGVDLRGLGAGSTLTLLNGRRMPGAAGGGFADISVIPASLVDRVQVLADGASAIYGSDAVGGVVDIVTRRNFEGLELRAKAGTVIDGGKRDIQTSVTAGADWTGGNGVVSISYSDRGELKFDERDFVEPGSLFNFEDASLIPPEEVINIFSSTTQNISPKLNIAADVFYTKRDIRARNQTGGSLNNLTSSVFFVNSRLSYELDEGRFFEAYADYGANNGERLTLLTSGVETLSSFKDTVLTLEGKSSGRLFDLPGGEASGAVGGLYRKESFKQIGSSGAVNVDASRDVYSAYGELLIPVFGEQNAAPLLRRFEISIAGRYEDYEDVGDSFTPKIGAYWEPFSGLSLHGGYSESFRVPTIQNLNGSQSVVFVGLDNPGLGAAAEDPRLLPGLVYGLTFDGATNPNLTPESADVWNVGADWQHDDIPGFSVGVTYFNINYGNRIFDVPSFQVAGLAPFGIAALPEFASLLDVNPDPSEIQALIDNPANDITNFLFFTAVDPSDPTLVPAAGDVRIVEMADLQNIATSIVRGLDFYADYEIETDIGQFAASLNGTYLTDNQFQATADAETLNRLNLVYRPVDLNLRGSLAWRRNGFTVFGAVNYTDSYSDNLNNPLTDADGLPIPLPVSAWTTVDLTVSYDSSAAEQSPLPPNMQVSLSVTNLLDKDPPFVTSTTGYNFDPANADPLGRYISFQISKRW